VEPFGQLETLIQLDKLKRKTMGFREAKEPSQWTRLVNGVQSEAELSSLRHSLARGAPFGNTQWQASTAKKLGLESSLRPRRRPKKLNK
jgi:putative transposase